MTSIKAKFRPSKENEKEGQIYYQIIHNRTSRKVTTEFKVYSREWNASRMNVNCDRKSDRLS